MRCIELAWGFDPWEAVLSIELGEAPALPARPVRPAAVVVLHPGPGRVARLRGLDAVRAHPAHVESHLKVGPGDVVGERVGVGQDVGRVLLTADDQSALDAAIRYVEESLVIELEGPGDP